MEELIRQAFLHVEVIGPHVADGHYDLVGPNGDIILPQVWETVVEPDWTITMHMWPMPEKPKTPIDDIPLIDDPLMMMDDYLAPKGGKGKGGKKVTTSKSSKGKGIPPPPPDLFGDLPMFPPSGVEIVPPSASAKSKATARPKPVGGLASWMTGQRPKPKPALKVVKRPESVTGSQYSAGSRTAADPAACIVM